MDNHRSEVLPAQYRHLYELPVVGNSDGSRSFHEGRLYRYRGLNVLLLRGDFVEMAFQHGRLLSDEIPMGAIVQAAKIVSGTIANTRGSGKRSSDSVVAALLRYLTWRMDLYSRRLVSRIVDEYALPLEFRALSEAAGIPAKTVAQAIVNPDLLMFLASYFGHSFVARGTCPAIGCSSFAAWGKYTKDGNPVIGHNMDYPLNGFYDRFPTVIYYEPPAPALRYMSFVSAGVHYAGMTSYNEAGVFLGTHVVPSTDVSLSGVPAVITGDLVIRRARTIESAIEYIRQLPSAAGWSYFLASPHGPFAGTLEVSHRRSVFRTADDQCHVQTNHYIAPTMRNRNLFLNRSVDEDSVARLQRMQQRLKDSLGKLDARGAISILGDQVDPLVNQVRGLGNTVGVHTTMTSVVIDPAHDRAMVAVGSAPVCHSDYVSVPLISSFGRGEAPNLQGETIRAGEFSRRHPEKIAALQAFILAKAAYENENNAAQAYAHLQEAVRLDASNPAYFFQLGIFSLKTGRFEDGCRAFSDALGCKYLTKQLFRLVHYYRGRTLAHLRRPIEAMADLNIVLSDLEIDKKMLAAARRAASRIGTFGGCPLQNQSLDIMMQQSDMLKY